MKLAFKPDLITADLATSLESLNPQNSLQERVDALGDIMDWIRLPVKTPKSNGEIEFIHSRDVRAKFLFSFLDRHDKYGLFLAQTINEILVPGSAVGLYCLTGISENTGFFNELFNRISQKILPDTYSEEDLAELFRILFTSEEDALWIEASLPKILPWFREFSNKYHLKFEAIESDTKDAIVILGAQVATLGSSKDIRRRLHGKRLTDTTFVRLNAVINSEKSQEEILQEIQNTRLDLMTVRNNIEASGVSVDLIFKLEKIQSILDRIVMLIHLQDEEHAGSFFGRLIRDDLKGHGVKVYIKENLHLLTRKIVERAGEKGEHYIATNKEERRVLFVASAWAGVVTAFTTLFKFYIGVQALPIFFEGFFFFINYALGFLVLQKWHLALSSKQPAYTASALSRKFEAFKKTKELTEVSLEIKKIISSQFLTTIGNLLWVAPIVIGIDWLWVLATGQHIMSVSEAHGILDKHNLFTSLTIPYAFLTGALLWLSSVISGWVENWLVFRDIPEAMRVNPVLKKVFGKDQLSFIAKNFSGTMGGIAGNLSIAFFLASPIVIGKFTGLPLDIRHVTLAAGTITLALNTLEWNLFEYWDQVLLMGLSITVIGLLNFSVSFYFAIRMAALARDVESKYLKIIFKYSFKKKAG